MCIPPRPMSIFQTSIIQECFSSCSLALLPTLPGTYPLKNLFLPSVLQLLCPLDLLRSLKQSDMTPPKVLNRCQDGHQGPSGVCHTKGRTAAPGREVTCLPLLLLSSCWEK